MRTESKEKLRERIRQLERICRIAQVPDILIKCPELIDNKPILTDLQWAIDAINKSNQNS
jgi:hypothetical protein